MTVRILTGDCRQVLDTLPENSVQMCCTSPPYWGLRSYLPEGHTQKHLEIGSEPTVDEWVATMVDVFRKVRRVLRDDGVLFLNLGDSYAGNRGAAWGPSQAATQARAMTASRRRDDAPVPRSDRVVDGLKPKDLIGQPWRVAFALQADGWWLRQEIIWSKANPMPESARDRCTKSHEHIFLLSKSAQYFWNFDAIQEPAIGQTEHDLTGPGYKAPGQVAHTGSRRNSFARETKNSAGTHGQKAQHRADREAVVYGGTRNPRSVWHFPTEPFKGAHFATFPRELAQRCIAAGTREGDTVLDPFGGSGTTGMVADAMQRHAILIDLDERNVPMARGRVEGDAPLFAEVT